VEPDCRDANAKTVAPAAIVAATALVVRRENRMVHGVYERSRHGVPRGRKERHDGAHGRNARWSQQREPAGAAEAERGHAFRIGKATTSTQGTEPASVCVVGGPKKPRTIVSLTKAWKRACVDAGCPGRIPHDLRRTAVRNLTRVGVATAVATKILATRPTVFFVAMTSSVRRIVGRRR
jgi:hypothetical protein